MEATKTIPGVLTSARLKATAEAMRTVRESFRQYLKDIGLEEQAVHDWLVVFSEAMSNAIEHGARSDKTQDIDVRWAQLGDTLELTVSDPGLGFYQTDSSALLRSRGRGLQLIAHYCDEVQHWVNPAGGHTIRMVKKMQGKLLKQKSNDQQEDGALVKLLADVYGNLGLPVSAAAMLEPLMAYVRKRWEGKLQMTLQAAPGYETVAQTLSIYSGAEETKKREDKETDEKRWPLTLGKRTVGVLKVKGVPPEDLKIVESLGRCVGLALENERQQETAKKTTEAMQALKIAANLQSRQKKLQAATKAVKGRIYAFEARAQTVAGDIIEGAVMPDGGTTLVIADVMGKGVAAAFLGGIFRGGWHLLAKRQTHPLLMMKEMNAYLYDELNGQAMFVTSALAHVSADGESLSIVNAGHTPIYYQEKGAGIKVIEPSGPPLGLFPAPEYEMITLPTAQVERLYMPTDGLYSWGEDAAHFDAKKLEKIFQAHARQAPQVLWENLQTLREAAAEVQVDDQALLVWENA